MIGGVGVLRGVRVRRRRRRPDRPPREIWWALGRALTLVVLQVVAGVAVLSEGVAPLVGAAALLLAGANALRAHIVAWVLLTWDEVPDWPQEQFDEMERHMRMQKRIADYVGWAGVVVVFVAVIVRVAS